MRRDALAVFVVSNGRPSAVSNYGVTCFLRLKPNTMTSAIRCDFAP